MELLIDAPFHRSLHSRLDMLIMMIGILQGYPTDLLKVTRVWEPVKCKSYSSGGNQIAD